MALKQEIEKAYKEWEKGEEEIGVTPATHKALYDGMKKLKDDLCTFADEFEVFLNKIRESEITEKEIDDIYKSIDKKFIEPIQNAGGLVDLENTDFKEISIRRLNTLFSKFGEYFKSSNDWLSFLKEYSGFTEKFYGGMEAGCKLLLDMVKCARARSEESADRIMKENGEILTATKLMKFLKTVLTAAYKNFETSIDKMEPHLKRQRIEKEEEYFYDDSQSGIVSKAIHYFLPSLWESYTTRAYDKPMLASAPKEARVFNGKPNLHDVEQALPNCFLMATLMALAKRNPKVITDCFIDSPDNLDALDKLDKIQVRLFAVDKSYLKLKGKKFALNIFDGKSDIGKHIKEIVYTIKKSQVIIPSKIKNNVLWPKLIEKAYLMYKKDGYEFVEEPENGDKQHLKGGFDEIASFALTGKIPKSIECSDESIGERLTADNLVSTITEKFGEDAALTCGFKHDFKIKDVKSPSIEIEIYSHHAYSISGIMEAKDPKNKYHKDYIRLVDPNKSWGRPIEFNSKNRDESGHIAMSFEDFCDNYRDITRVG